MSAEVPSWRSLFDKVMDLNPYRLLADRLEPGDYLLYSIAGSVGLLILTPSVIEMQLLGLLLLLGLDGLYTSRSASDESLEVDHARSLFLQGEIGLEEFESRLDQLLDRERQEVRRRVERINGIGPDRSSRIASEFTVGDLRVADVDELTSMHGIGESTAIEILREFSSERATQTEVDR